MSSTLLNMRNKDQTVSYIQNRTTLGDFIQHDSGLQQWVGTGDKDEAERKCVSRAAVVKYPHLT